MRLSVSRRAMLGAGAALLAGAAAPSRRRIVASFSILADITANVAGQPVDMLAPRGVDPHGFEPRPQDAARLAGAEILVLNGLGFDGFAARLAKAAGFAGKTIVASGQARPVRGVDPHVWMAVPGAIAAAEAIAAGLGVDASAYVGRLRALDVEVRTTLAAVPAERRILITPHDSFSAFAKAYGFEHAAVQGGAGGEASAAQVAALIRTVRQRRAPALFMETAIDPRALRQVEAETGARIAGPLFADTLTGANGPAPSYIGLMRYNARTIAAALTPGG